MKERPILFNGPMVNAVLDGSKRQTRRIVKHQPPVTACEVFTFHHPHPREHFYAFDGDVLLDWAYPCPHGEVGDRLWVRETWQHSNHPLGPYDEDCEVFYRADYLGDSLGPDLERSKDGIRRQWKPSIHMPRWASRITLEITGVRVERLQAISHDDALAEGVADFAATLNDEPHPSGESPEQASRRLQWPQRQFRQLWESISGPGSWDANPWVWVIEFKRIDGAKGA